MSSRETMIAFLKHLDERYGGAVSYIKKYIGFTDEEIETIRNNTLAAVQE